MKYLITHHFSSYGAFVKSVIINMVAFGLNYSFKLHANSAN